MLKSIPTKSTGKSAKSNIIWRNRMRDAGIESPEPKQGAGKSNDDLLKMYGVKPTVWKGPLTSNIPLPTIHSKSISTIIRDAKDNIESIE